MLKRSLGLIMSKKIAAAADRFIELGDLLKSFPKVKKSAVTEALITEGEKPVIPAYPNRMTDTKIIPRVLPCFRCRKNGNNIQIGAMMKPTCKPDTAIIWDNPVLENAFLVS